MHIVQGLFRETTDTHSSNRTDEQRGHLAILKKRIIYFYSRVFHDKLERTHASNLAKFKLMHALWKKLIHIFSRDIYMQVHACNYIQYIRKQTVGNTASRWAEKKTLMETLYNNMNN